MRFYEIQIRNSLEAVEWSTSRLANGRYSVTVVSSGFLDKISPGSLVHCELKIPGTGYVKRKSMLYYPPSKYFNFKGDVCLFNLISILK